MLLLTRLLLLLLLNLHLRPFAIAAAALQLRLQPLYIRWGTFSCRHDFQNVITAVVSSPEIAVTIAVLFTVSVHLLRQHTPSLTCHNDTRVL